MLEALNAYNPDDLNLISGTHVVKERTDSPMFSLDLDIPAMPRVQHTLAASHQIKLRFKRCHARVLKLRTSFASTADDLPSLELCVLC